MLEAFRDVFEAIEMSTHRSALSIRMAAISLLSGLLVRYGTLEDVRYALDLLVAADRELARKRVRRQHVNRVKIRWGKAVALARLGAVERAEAIMTEVVETLIASNVLGATITDALDTLVWIVGERAGQSVRAAYFKQRYTRIAEGVERL